MKFLSSSIFRAICALVTGALLVQYRDQTLTWMIVAIGILFFVSGVVSCISYFVARSKQRNADVEVYDANGHRLTPLRPMFPIVGLGSILLGLVLAVMPTTFITSLMYILAAILVLGAIGQFAMLISVARVARVGIFFWVMPSLTLLVAIVAIVHPESIASAPLFVIGWTMMIYGVVEIINTIHVHRLRRALQRNISTTNDNISGEAKEDGKE